MRVMCIKPINCPAENAKGRPVPQVGDIDTVIDTYPTQWGDYYVLERFGEEDAFDPERFAILPSSTSDEMAEEVRESILM